MMMTKRRAMKLSMSEFDESFSEDLPEDAEVSGTRVFKICIFSRFQADAMNRSRAEIKKHIIVCVIHNGKENVTKKITTLCLCS